MCLSAPPIAASIDTRVGCLTSQGLSEESEED